MHDQREVPETTRLLLTTVQDGIRREGSRAKLEQAIGLPENILRGLLATDRTRVPSVENAKQIAEALGFEFYIGPPRSVQDNTSAPLQAVPLDYSEQLAPPDVEGLEAMVEVRLHPQKFAAGDGEAETEPGSLISSLSFPAPWLRRLGLNAQSAALVWVKGDSMTPTLKNGAMAMLDTRINDVKKRKIYAFRYGEELFIKRLERIAPDTLIAFSDNAAYDTIAIVGTDLEQFQMFGEVVWSGHRVGK
jgi:phage repressor protein C with HTH and peptisase S24 domain